MDVTIQTQLFTKAAGSQLCKHASVKAAYTDKFYQTNKDNKSKKITFVILLFFVCFVL